MAKKSKGKKPAVAGLDPVKTEAGKEVEVQAKVGRPSSWTQEVANALCEYIEEGGSLVQFCAMEGNPNKSTVLRWLRDNAAFRAQYTYARARQMDHYADEIVQVAYNTEEGVETTVDEEGGVTVKRGDMLGHRRLKVDTLKWLMSKLAPKKYGDRVEVEQSGEVKHTISFRRG